MGFLPQTSAKKVVQDQAGGSAAQNLFASWTWARRLAHAYVCAYRKAHPDATLRDYLAHLTKTYRCLARTDTGVRWTLRLMENPAFFEAVRAEMFWPGDAR